jgi:hypothetical protein
MSKRHHPDRKQESDWEHDPEDYQDIENEQDDENLRLWGPEDKSETEYGDLRDQSFQAGKTSRPGSIEKESREERGWQADDAPRQEQDDQRNPEAQGKTPKKHDTP